GAMLPGKRGRELGAVGNVGDHHPRAFGGERLNVMPPDAPGAAGDDGDASVQSCHGRASVLFRRDRNVWCRPRPEPGGSTGWQTTRRIAPRSATGARAARGGATP